MTTQQKTEGEESSKEDLTKSVIDLNTATKEQLATLPGIGESRAESILEYRKKVGAFTAIEEIMNISGIGEAMFAKIKISVSLSLISKKLHCYLRRAMNIEIHNISTPNGISAKRHASAIASACDSVKEKFFNGRGGMLSILSSSSIQSTAFIASFELPSRLNHLFAIKFSSPKTISLPPGIFTPKFSPLEREATIPSGSGPLKSDIPSNC